MLIFNLLISASTFTSFHERGRLFSIGSKKYLKVGGLTKLNGITLSNKIKEAHVFELKPVYKSVDLYIYLNKQIDDKVMSFNRYSIIKQLFVAQNQEEDFQHLH